MPKIALTRDGNLHARFFIEIGQLEIPAPPEPDLSTPFVVNLTTPPDIFSITFVSSSAPPEPSELAGFDIYLSELPGFDAGLFSP